MTPGQSLIKEWVLANSFDQKVEQQLRIDSRSVTNEGVDAGYLHGPEGGATTPH
jgi:hypothetical protein